MEAADEQPCPLCGTTSPCRWTDARNARLFECLNEKCGPSNITQTAEQQHLKKSEKLRTEISREAQLARRNGMVLRVWVESGQLHRAVVTHDSIKW